MLHVEINQCATLENTGRPVGTRLLMSYSTITIAGKLWWGLSLHEHNAFVPGLQCSKLVVLTSKDYHEVAQEPLAVFVDEISYEVQSQEHHVEEKGKVGGPVNVLEGDHKLREKNQGKVTPRESSKDRLVYMCMIQSLNTTYAGQFE